MRDHPLASGCGALDARLTAEAHAERATPPAGDAAAAARAEESRPDHALEVGHRGAVVWPESTSWAYRLRHSRLVAFGSATGADSVGPHPRSGRVFAPQALRATKLALAPRQILSWFIRRWRLETTFEAARAQLGFETSRQWNDRSVSRTTPAVFGLDSIVTLAAAQLIGDRPAPVRTTAWYPQPQATFSDAIALVRRSWWHVDHLPISSAPLDVVKIPRSLLDRLTDALCYAP